MHAIVDEIRPRKLSQPAQIDYLVIGHLTVDLTDEGTRLGGTAAFSSLTASALGLKTGIITSHSPDLDVTPVQSLLTLTKPSEVNTTFKNISDGNTRKQYLYHVAERLTIHDLPPFSNPPKIVHLGPVANEVDWQILGYFPQSLKCLTPQGWLRGTASDHQVIYHEWEAYEKTLQLADIAVISIDDVMAKEETITKMSSLIPVLVVTENYRGARVYWNNDARFISAPEVKYVDDTGAGDIFATAFFYRYHFTKDPWEAGRFAVRLASGSVTRAHLESIPTQAEVNRAKIHLIDH
jgi:hypothetical protein